MRTSSRLLDRRVSAALVLAAIGASGGGAASCSSDGDVVLARQDNEDAAPPVDASSTMEDVESDRPTSPFRDAATSDASPEPVTCTTSPCALALVTNNGNPDRPDRTGFCALLADKTVACWGNNEDAQLGLDPNPVTGVFASAVPSRVPGLTDIRYLDRGCAIDGAGATWCWGTGAYLQSKTSAGTTEITPVKLPIPPASRVSVARYEFGGNTSAANTYYVGCAVVDTGVICWGNNGMGHLGPIELEATPATVYEPRAIPIPSGAPIERLVVGWTAFALRSDGTALSWGANPPLGRVSSLFPDPYPRPIELEGVSQIDAAGANACAVVQGIGYCWGANPNWHWLYGEDNPMKFALPAPILTPEPIVDIAAHSSLSSTTPQPPGGRGCAVGVSGDVYCWGANESGQVGDGTRDYALDPVKVVGLPARASRVALTAQTSCALLVDGQVYCWGYNKWGQLGTGDMKVPSPVPQKVLLP